MVQTSSATAEDEDFELQEAEIAAEMAEENEDKRRERQMSLRIGRIKSKVSQYVSISFGQMGAAGASDTANLLTGLQYLNKDDEKDVAGWENFVQMLFAEYLPSARILYARMHRELDRGHGSISVIDIAEWEAFYRSPAYEYKHKESQIHHALPIEIDQSIAIRLERDQLLDQAEARHIPASYALRDDSSFLSMSLSRRRSAVAAFREDVRSLAGEMQAAHSQLRNELLSHAGGENACLSYDEAYRWLGRAFDQAENAKDVAQFRRTSILPVLAKAALTRHHYNEVEGVLDTFAETLPPAFRRRTKASFLLMAPEARSAYVESARIAARAASTARNAEEAEAKAAEASERAVRAALAANDWRAAKVHLDTLTDLDSRHPSLPSLIIAVDVAQAESEKEEAVVAAREALDLTVKTIGQTSLAGAYEAALNEGGEHFDSFTLFVERRLDLPEEPKPVAEKMPRAEVKKEKIVEKKPQTEAKKSDELEEVVEVEAQKTEKVAETIETLRQKDETKKKPALALKADGDVISKERQAEAAKLHPWMKHHLGVLERHGSRFKAKKTEELDPA